MKINTLLLKIIPAVFGLAIFILGFQHAYYRTMNPALFPVPAKFPALIFLVYASGIIMMACGIAAFIRRWRNPAFFVIGVLFLVSFLLIHLPLLFSNIKNPMEWTASFETLAIMSGAFLFALYSGSGVPVSPSKIYNPFEKVSKFMFAISLVVFGVQHLQYGNYVAHLIPNWIPLHLFWAYFIGICFIAAAISLIINVKQQLAMALLGTMFLFWVIFLHTPLVYNHIGERDELSSMMIALLMACIGFLIMASYKIR